MKLGIMQPYFFPYLGYYSLIKATDNFILFDTVQFIQKGWIERNRILKPGPGFQYISVPLVKHKKTILIKEIEIRNSEDWRDRIIRQLEHYKKRAPYYKETIDIVEESLGLETTSIVELNANVLKKTCEYLGISLNLDIYSKMDLIIDEVTHPGEWALNISKALNAEEYINPCGGTGIFKSEQFTRENISLKFLSNNLNHYSQRRQSFEAGLSIIDVMMFNDVENINKLIDDFEIRSKEELEQKEI